MYRLDDAMKDKERGVTVLVALLPVPSRRMRQRRKLSRPAYIIDTRVRDKFRLFVASS